MDTKWKGWKAVLSAVAFFVGVSLLCTSIPSLYAVSVRDHERGKELLGQDYQETWEFQQLIARRMDCLLTMAVGGPFSYRGPGNYGIGNGYGGSYTHSAEEEERFFEEMRMLEEMGDSEGIERLLASWEWFETEETGFTQEELSRFSANARKAHEEMREDGNLLYTVTYDGEIKFTNADGKSLDGPTGVLPDGYNFLLYFDGSTARIQKDGKELDIYGDGYYEEGRDWRVPGYYNFTVDEQTKKVTVTLAAAAEPKLYIKGDYANTGYSQGEADVYWIWHNFHRSKSRVRQACVFFVLGLLLTGLSVCWRADKRRADEWIARITGKVWMEPKAVAVALCVAVFLYGPSNRYGGYSLWQEFRTGYERVNMDMLLRYVQELVYDPFGLLCLVWGGAFFINDLRYNPHPWKNSLCGRMAAMVRLSDTRYPFQKRLTRRFRRAFGAALGMGGAAALLSVVIAVITAAADVSNVRMTLVPLTGALLGLVAGTLCALYQAGKQVTQATADAGAIAEHVESIREGNLCSPLTLPDDSALYETAQSLNDIREGMQAAVEEQTRNERFKVELISNVSHDIKTPLTSIISYVDLLSQEQLPDAARDYVQVIQKKAARLKTMVQDVFEVSKAASGELPVHLEGLDFGKLLRQTLADMDGQIAQSTVQVKANIPEEPVPVRADGQRMYRVFQNLLKNALDYSLDGTRVYVTLTVADGKACASIKNTSSVEIEQGVDFTERFVRGDQSRTDGGSGLGLSIASSFTEACGGTFSVDSIADLFIATVEFPLNQL